MTDKTKWRIDGWVKREDGKWVRAETEEDAGDLAGKRAAAILDSHARSLDLLEESVGRMASLPPEWINKRDDLLAECSAPEREKPEPPSTEALVRASGSVATSLNILAKYVDALRAEIDALKRAK